jgi:hypothetical protein
MSMHEDRSIFLGAPLASGDGIETLSLGLNVEVAMYKYTEQEFNIF